MGTTSDVCVHWLAKHIWNTGYPAFLKSHVKIFTPRTWKITCLKRYVLFSVSMTTLQVVIGSLVRFPCSFNYTNCIYIISTLSGNPQHTMKTALNTASSIHPLSMFVNAENKDVAVSRFRVPATGANATRKMARGRNGSLETTMLASSLSYAVWKRLMCTRDKKDTKLYPLKRYHPVITFVLFF